MKLLFAVGKLDHSELKLLAKEKVTNAAFLTLKAKEASLDRFEASLAEREKDVQAREERLLRKEIEAVYEMLDDEQQRQLDALFESCRNGKLYERKDMT